MSEKRVKPLAPSGTPAIAQSAFNVWFKAATDDECVQLDRVHSLVNPQNLAVTMGWVLEQALQNPTAKGMIPPTLLALLEPNAAGR